MSTTMRRFRFKPSGTAAHLRVTEFTESGLNGPSEIPVIFMSHERGAVVGIRDTPLAQYGWPEKVQAEINKHFGTVFSLEHENWRKREPSPRAAYVDELEPWEIEVPHDTDSIASAAGRALDVAYPWGYRSKDSAP